ncbi:MAG TPA: arginine repressor [Bacteroidota bacterium]|nr:arginine repressor [Bacteroidota bacterium]
MKKKRQFLIKQIIAHQPIASQEDLCRVLRKAGFNVTQATLSRDLKELGIARVHTPQGVKYELRPEMEERRLQSIVGYEVESVDANEAFVVIKTLPGRAQGVASIIDSLHHPYILGTLAGDNTIFVTPTSTKKTGEILRFLRDLMMKERQVA